MRKNTELHKRCCRSLDSMKASIIRMLEGKRDVELDERIMAEENAKFHYPERKWCRVMDFFHYADREPLSGETLHLIYNMCGKGYAVVLHQGLSDALSCQKVWMENDVCHKLISCFVKSVRGHEWVYVSVVAAVTRLGRQGSLDFLRESGLEYEMGEGKPDEMMTGFVLRHWRGENEARLVSLFVSREGNWFPELLHRYYHNEILSGLAECIKVEDVARCTNFRELYNAIFAAKESDEANCDYLLGNLPCEIHCFKHKEDNGEKRNFLISSCCNAEMEMLTGECLEHLQRHCNVPAAIVKCNDERVRMGEHGRIAEMIGFFKEHKIRNKMVCGCFLNGNKIAWGVAFVVILGDEVELGDLPYEVCESLDIDANVDAFMMRNYGNDARYVASYVNPDATSYFSRILRHYSFEIGY